MLRHPSVEKIFNVGSFSAQTAVALGVLAYWLPSYTKTVNGELDVDSGFLVLYLIDRLFITALAAFIACFLLLLMILITRRIAG